MSAPRRLFVAICGLMLASCTLPAGVPRSLPAASETAPVPAATPTLSAAELVSLGEAAAAVGDWGGAIVFYDQSIALDATNAQAFLLRGNAYKELGILDQAISNYDAAIALDPLFATAFNNRGLAHAGAGNNDLALADFAAAIEIFPTFALAFRNRAEIQEAAGNLAAAALDLQVYLTLIPYAPDEAEVQARIEELQGEVLAAAGEDGLLFFDDFSDTASGWYTNGDPASPGVYSGGGYVLIANQPLTGVWAMPGRLFADVRIEVSARKQGGGQDDFFGVLCRVNGTGINGEFYAFIISSDGFFTIAKRVDDDPFVSIGQDGMLASPHINKGEGDTNTIRGICSGNRLSFYVNDHFVAETVDTDLITGQPGLIVGNFEQDMSSIFFDDFKVYVETP
ncbi:MAG: tetratricopeptide repeat protein [Anaerolineales bacterium]